MRKEFLNSDYTEKEVKLTIRVPKDFDREDERMLDDEIAALLFKQGWELVDSKEYRDIEPDLLPPTRKPALAAQISSAAARASSTPTYSLEELDIHGMLQTLEHNAWSGRTPTTIRLSAGEHTVKLMGYIYEPSYENFSTSSSISLDGEVLYGLDSRNVDAYRNDVYQAGCCESLREALAMIKEATEGHRFTIERDPKSQGHSYER